jgi:hypothetical protein
VWPFQTTPAKKEVFRGEERMAQLESKLRALELDWEEVYEKIRRTMQRISKRAEFIEKAEARSEAPPEPMQNGADGAMSPATGRLSDRQRAIQTQILKRRGGG